MIDITSIDSFDAKRLLTSGVEHVGTFWCCTSSLTETPVTAAMKASVSEELLRIPRVLLCGTTGNTNGNEPLLVLNDCLLAVVFPGVPPALVRGRRGSWRMCIIVMSIV